MADDRPIMTMTMMMMMMMTFY